MSIECGITGDKSYSDKLTEIYTAGLKRLADRLTSGSIAVDDWHQQMKDAIDKMYHFQAMAGVNGDQSKITADDRKRLVQSIADQYKYLDGFTSKIESAVSQGGSLNFVANQAGMYAASSQAEYWRQAIEVDLPNVPGDGSTACLGNCSCSVDTECEYDNQGKVTAVLAYWNLDPTKEEVHCLDCPHRAETWNPLRIPV